MPRKTRAYTQWTADTEIAFVMALRFHGRATLAAAEIGRTAPGAYLRRNRLPDFAAKWDDALDQWRRANASDTRNAAGLDEEDRPPNPPHFDGWTPVRRRAFLRVLGETGKIAEACTGIGLSEGGAYALRRRDPTFATAWDRALSLSPGVLEQVAIERAVEGVEEQVWHAGKVVGTRRRYSEVLLRSMVTRNEPPQRKHRTRKELEKAAADAAHAAGGSFIRKHWRTEEEVFATLETKLDKLARHQRRELAGKAERWLAEGKIP